MNDSPHVLRNAERSDLDPLAQLWHEGWQEAHAQILPPVLAQFRTLPGFRSRLEAALHEVRVSGAPGAPLGFSMLKDDELYQLYVAPAARGSGVAVTLLTDAEQQLAARGIRTAWLACAIGNHRAARFYQKNGWRRAGTVRYDIPTPDGILPLEVWRFEKPL
jgi:ribosomal protein S18 acetylase RimI-like enzyme